MNDPLPPSGMPPPAAPPRMTAQAQQSIPIDPAEVPEVQRFLEQMRAQKAMEAGGGSQDIAKIVSEFMKRQLSLIRHRAANLPDGVDPTHAFLEILDEHIKALE